jgi:hypothetical protein
VIVLCTVTNRQHWQGQLYWIAPPIKRFALAKIRPAAAADPPEAIIPRVEEMLNLARGEFNLTLFNQLFMARLMADGSLDDWRDQLRSATLICHPHADGGPWDDQLCHRHVLGRYLAYMLPGRQVMDVTSAGELSPVAPWRG